MRMAKWMKFRSVAEGVETKKEWDFLKSVECDLVQGYYFYKPMPRGEFERLLDETELKKATSAEDNFSEYDDIISDAFKHGDSRESTLFYSMLGGMGVLEMTEDGIEIIQVNKGYYEVLYNRPTFFPEETKMLHRQLQEPEKSLLMEKCLLAKETDMLQQIQLHHERDDGEFVWLNVKIRHIGSRGKRSLFYFAMDNIDELKKAEQERYRFGYCEALFKVFDKVYSLDYSDGMAEVLYTNGEDKMQVGEKYYFKNFFDRFQADIETVTGKHADEILKHKELLDEELRMSKDGSFSVSYQLVNKDVKINEITSLFFKIEARPGKEEYLCCVKKK